MKHLTLSLLLLCGLTLQAQQRVHNAVNPFDTLYLYGNCQVTVARGDDNTIDYTRSDTLLTLQSGDSRVMLGSRVVQHGNSLTIFDFSGTQYWLELGQDTLAKVVVHAYPGFDCTMDKVAVKLRMDYNEDSLAAQSSAASPWQGDYQRLAQLTEQIVAEYAALSDEVSQLMGQSRTSKHEQKKHYSWSDRTDLSFRWAFTNWVASPMDGLAGVQTPGYDIRTAFSSYQLEAGYALCMNDHWRFMLGLGYESDVYKYGRTPYVGWEAQEDGLMALVPHEEGPNGGGWETRLVARYVTMPISLEWRTRTDRKRALALSVIPGLNYTSYLRYIRSDCGNNESWKAWLAGAVNPFKCDLRFDVKLGGLGLFVQVPTMPLFVGEGMEKVYPVKLGFRI